mgnify:CR=1 FL=1
MIGILRRTPLFQNREEAGRQLARKLLHLKDKEPVVLGLPRGGIPVALEVARALEAPLDLLLVRKIGVPGHSELAAGAVVDGRDPQTVLNSDIVRVCNVPDSYIEQECRRQIAEIERRRRLYLGARPPPEIAGRTVIVVDDGIATGATVRAGLRSLRQQQAGRRVLAVPLAPPEAVSLLEKEADEVVVLAAPHEFGAISLYYRDFHQLEDQEVIALLAQSPRRLS